MSANYDSSLGATEGSKARSGTSRSLSEQSGRVIEEVQELGRSAASSLSDAASTLKEKGQAALETGKEKAGRAKDGFDAVVSAHPAKSVLIALGAGALIGYMLRRRS